MIMNRKQHPPWLLAGVVAIVMMGVYPPCLLDIVGPLLTLILTFIAAKTLITILKDRKRSK